MTRVLMFCSHFWPVVGGAERQAQRLAHALLERGCHVEVLTAWRDPSWPEVETEQGLRIHRFTLTDLSARFPHLRGLGIPNLWMERGEVSRAVRRVLPGFDLLHVHIASPVAVFAMDAAHALGKPVLCKIACGGTGFDFVKLRRVSVLGRVFERRLVRGVDRWIAISSEVRRDLVAAGVPPQRIASIPNGIDVAPSMPARPARAARRFLCMGRHAKLDLDTLLRAFDALAAERPDVELRIAGAGDTGRVQEHLARLPHARSRTAVVGVSPAEQEFAWADALVHPSFAEGVSNVLLEAVSVGLPVVASDIPPNREVIGDEGGLLVPLRDVPALHEALAQLAQHAETGAARARAGRQRLEQNYALGGVADRHLGVYQELVADGPRRR